MQINLRGARLKVALEGCILPARGLPVCTELANHRRIEACVAIAVTQRLHDRTKAGLRCRARHCIDCRIGGVDSGVGRCENSCSRDPRSIMRVQVQRQTASLAQRLDQHARARWPQETCHILDREDMAACPLQLFGDADVIVERIFGPVGIENVACVTDRPLGEFACLANRVDCDAHVLNPVEAIENTEKIDPSGCAADKIFHHIVWIIGVANTIGAAQQHLRQEIWRPLSHERETLPGIFGKKPHRDIESGTAPAFER